MRIILCGLPTLSLNLKRARTYAERMFRHVVVGNLERDDAEEALAIPLAGSGRSFGLSLIGEIVEQTAGYPYFLQFFGGFLCSRLGLEHIELADFQRVESALLHELDLAFFEDRFEVRRAADSGCSRRWPAPAGGSSLRRSLADLATSTSSACRRLVDRGLVYRPTRGTYDFALPLFGATPAAKAKLTRLTKRSVRNSVRTPRDNDDA